MLETLSSQLLSLSAFHFLRPWWLLALLPAILFSWLLFRHQQQAGSWQTVIQADLLPFLLDGKGRQQQQRYFLWALLFWCLASIAIAGPSWTKKPMPVHKQQNPLVVLLDLSPSMLAEDLKPNRLIRARLKLTDFLALRQEGTTALIAYADDAHVVTPLTDDTATIISLVASLHPNIMPAAGSKPLAALQKSLEIILQAGHQSGDLLLISDGITNSDAEAITSFLSSMGGFRLSVLGLGSKDGAPIPSEQGGFVKDKHGDIVIARLNSKRLRKVARENDGHYATISVDNSDLKHLKSGIDNPDSNTEQLDRTFDTWQDNGFWLTLILLPLIFLSFRRNIIIVLMLTPTLFFSEGSQAFEWTDLSWKDLWKTPDQQGQEAFNADRSDVAEELFNHPGWKGAAAYRNENYSEAAQAFANNTPTGQYNLGNSLARSGQLEEALKAYENVLASQPDHADAAFNKQVVEALLKQQQNQEQGQESGEPDDQSQQQSENQKNSEQNQNQSSDNPSKPEQEQKTQENQSENQSENENSKQEDLEQVKQKLDKDQSDQETQQAAEPRAQQDDLSREQRQAMEQWLRRVPDDPGGLLRRKFAYEAWLKKQSSQQNTKQQESQRW